MKGCLASCIGGIAPTVRASSSCGSLRLLWKYQLHQAEVFASKQPFGSPQLAGQLHQRLRLFVPLFFKHSAGKVHLGFLVGTVFPLRFGNLLVNDGQLLFQRSYDQVLATVVFGCRREVFRGLLRIGIGVLFALGIAPGHCLCISGGGIGFGLPGLGHVLFCLLLDLRQAGAEAVAFFVEL